ncbi:MAG: RDD family protein [Candidatus Asgardarchaeum californiense]|nr:MAG: RDD family protein [Candidatus Asgardarchaeum californiense]
MNEKNIKYAGFWIRVGATLIDSLILMMFTVPLALMYYGDSYQYAEHHSMVVDIFLKYIFPMTATIIFWIYKSATPGKIVLGLKILDASSGKPISPVQALVRYASYYVAAIPFDISTKTCYNITLNKEFIDDYST